MFGCFRGQLCACWDVCLPQWATFMCWIIPPSWKCVLYVLQCTGQYQSWYIDKALDGSDWAIPGQGHGVCSRLCCGSCGDCVIILAPLIPIHFHCLITSSVHGSVLSHVCVVVGELSRLCVFIKVKETTSSWGHQLKYGTMLFTYHLIWSF